MSLDKNVLAQSEQLIHQSQIEFESFLTQWKNNFATEVGILSYKHTLSIVAYRELAVFRMFEHAIQNETFTEEDGVEIKALLKKVREDGVESLSKFYTPEALERAQKDLDEKLEAMAKTNVEHHTPQ